MTGGYGLPAQRAPLCQQCPAEAFCQARKQGGEPKTCRSRPAKKPRRVEERVVFCSFGGKEALRRAAGQGLLAGLWESPTSWPRRRAPWRTGGSRGEGPWQDRGAHLYPCGMAYDGSVLAGTRRSCLRDGSGRTGMSCAGSTPFPVPFPLPGFGGRRD